MSGLVTLIGVIIASITALSVAHMHRKQMRQIEARRTNPSLPLRPPLHPFSQWCKDHVLLIILIIPAIDLVGFVVAPSALTIRVVLQIGLEFSIITAGVVVYFLLDLMHGLVDFNGNIIAFLRDLASQIASRNDESSRLS